MVDSLQWHLRRFNARDGSIDSIRTTTDQLGVKRFNSRDGAIDSYLESVKKESHTVSIPEMVRLIVCCINYQPRDGLSFNSRDGAIDRSISMGCRRMWCEFQFQRWCD